MNKNPGIYQLRRIVHRKLWWKDADMAAVDNFPWGSLDKDDYRPVTSAYAANDDQSLFVYMETDETELRAETKDFDYVHTDSCMEFFLSPEPESSRQYINWEFNPIGGMHLAIGTCRHDRTLIPEENYRKFFQIKTTTHAAGWNLEFCIPLAFLRRYFPSMEFNHPMRGNFYKCGDKTPRPHFGCWSPIDLGKSDFHCPDYFGALIFKT